MTILALVDGIARAEISGASKKIVGRARVNCIAMGCMGSLFSKWDQLPCELICFISEERCYSLMWDRSRRSGLYK